MISNPTLPDLSLTANIPNIELEPLRLDGLDIESLCGGDGVDVFAGECLEDCRLAGIVETQQEDPQLSVGRCFQLSGRSKIWLAEGKLAENSLKLASIPEN